MSDRKKILLVDDDPVFCEVTEELLQEIGYECVVAVDAGEARVLFLDNTRKFDLILIDHIFVENDELATEALRCRPDVPIALYSGARIPLKEVRSKGICAVIHKPVTKSELAAAIERILPRPA